MPNKYENEKTIIATTRSGQTVKLIYAEADGAGYNDLSFTLPENTPVLDIFVEQLKQAKEERSTNVSS